ncbi:Cytochrome c oxidase polypeptide II [hydrothermal vent metagenome]|uniref:cytochrome-c oxidase n=1 Tax=hydrothermal vent metagenome TaxID=652676 RepID=A0A3B0S912_9ZZZZ
MDQKEEIQEGRGVMRVLLTGLTASFTYILFATGIAHAGDGSALGHPEPWQLGLQQAASPSAEGIAIFHNLLMWIITIITVFVAGLLVYVMWRFSEKKNPIPSKTTHNTMLEVAWTVIPILILVVIAVPSFRLLYLQRDIPDAALTIKTTGNQWYWSYEYPEYKDAGGDAISFDSIMKTDEELKPGEPRLMAVDTPVIVPVNQIVKVIVTASDVLHAWTIPSFGAKIDAVPGRLNEIWFKADKQGVYYGQCSELCGKDHAYMPIEVRVVSDEDFKKWLEETKTAGLDAATKNVVAKMNADKAAAKVANLNRQ